MILRRFMQHLKEQNWFAVGLDVLVVIVGIFLGMQVTDWNETRKERQLQKVYIEKLIGDVQTDIDYFNRMEDESNDALARVKFLDDVLNNEALLEVSEDNRIMFATSVRTISWSRQWYLQSDTYEELLSTGNIRLITNPDIKEIIIDYYRQIKVMEPWKEAMETLSINYRLAMSGLLDVDFEIALRSREKIAVDIEQAKRIRENYLTRQHLINLIPSMASMHTNIRSRQRWYRRHAEEHKLKLQEYLTSL